MSKKSNQFSPQVRERAVRMVLEHIGQYPSLWAAIESFAPRIGCVPQSLNGRVKRHQIDSGARDSVIKARAARSWWPSQIVASSSPTCALEHNADIAKVQEWLRHANISTTRVYDRRGSKPEDSPTLRVVY